MCHLWLTLKELSIPDGERGNVRADAGMCCESDHVAGGLSPEAFLVPNSVASELL